MSPRRLWLWLKTMPHGFSTLVRGSFWLVLAAGLGQGSMLVATLLVANTLGVSDFGRYALLQSTTLLVAGMAQISMAVVIAQQVASLREQSPDKAGQIAAFCFAVTFLLGFGFAAIILIGRDVIGVAVFRDPELAGGLVAVALAVPWVAAAAVQQGLFTGLERFRDQAIISLVLVPVVIGLPALGAWRAGFLGAMFGLGLAYFFRFAITQAIVFRFFRKAGLRWTLTGLRQNATMIWRLALPATLAGILVSLAIWGGQTMLVRSQDGASALGLFAAAYMVKTVVMFVPSQTIVALLPLLSRYHAASLAKNRRSLLLANTAASLLLTTALAGAGIAVAPQILALFGEGFRGGGGVLVILLLATPVEAITISLYQEMQSKGRFWKAMLSVNLPLAAIVLGFALILIPMWSAHGLATAWLIGWLGALLGTLAALASETSGAAFGRRGDNLAS